MGAGGSVGPESGGREVSPAGPFLGAAGEGCLWSSLPRLWNTSSGAHRDMLNENII